MESERIPNKGLHTRPKSRAAVPRLADFSSDASSAHGSGRKEGKASASTDPFSFKTEAEGERFETKVKGIDNDELLTLSALLGFLEKACAEIVGRELHSRSLAVSHGFERSVPVKDDKGDESFGRPPSY